MNTVYLCLGGNIGDRESFMNSAISIIQKSVGEIIALSPMYETEAWGTENQQTYLNRCLCVYTPLSCIELIHVLLDIEKQLGRNRIFSETYENRTMDIDILFFNHDTIHQNNLVIPHPRLHLRNFVLIPLRDIAPNYYHPVLKQTVSELLLTCKDELKVTAFVNS